MKKYVLLMGVVCCFVSCSADDWENDVQEISLNEINPTSDPDKNWDKTRYNDNNPSDNDGN